jgi:hypothetical protein
MKTKLFYSVQNCGDGSAYPRLFECEELCKIDQKYMGEDGWGEECIGYFTIEHEGPIKILDHVRTIDEIIKETKDDLEEDWRSNYSKQELRKKLEELQKLKDKLNE